MKEPKLRRVDELTPDPENRRRRTARSRDMIVQSLKDTGAARSIVIDETGTILAGNGVADAAMEAGITKLRVIDAGGDELIAVRRTGLTDEQKRDLALFDNRTAELAEWDVAQLEKDQAAGLNLSKFFTAPELGSVLKVHPGRGLTHPDAIPARRATSIVRGTCLTLGDHRLLCGDATALADVERLLAGAAPAPGLMVTDPPYGVNYDPTWRMRAGLSHGTGKMGAVPNDDRADWTDAWRLFPGPVAYVFHGGLQSDVAATALKTAGFELRAQIIWAKDRLALSRGDYHWQHEPCWYAVRVGATGRRSDDRTQTTLWRIADSLESTLWEIPARDDDGHGHGTQKPVECMERPMRNHLAASVYDPFAGSGTTVIAAERLERRCYAIDIEPTYCQVIVDRWEQFTGRKAEPA